MVAVVELLKNKERLDRGNDFRRTASVSRTSSACNQRTNVQKSRILILTSENIQFAKQAQADKSAFPNQPTTKEKNER